VLLVIVFIYGPGTLIGYYTTGKQDQPSVPTCNGQVMQTTDICQTYTEPGGIIGPQYDYQQALQDERNQFESGLHAQELAGWILTSLDIAAVLLGGTYLILRARVRRVRRVRRARSAP
jgi:hypothetical protein